MSGDSGWTQVVPAEEFTADSGSNGKIVTRVTLPIIINSYLLFFAGYHNASTDVEIELQEIASGEGGVEGTPTILGNDSLQEALEDVLDTRPTLAMGRQVSLHRRSRGSTFERSLQYRSLPAAHRRPLTSSAAVPVIRRSSSVPALNDPEFRRPDVLEDIDEGEFDFNSELRKSSRRLRERIVEQ